MSDDQNDGGVFLIKALASLLPNNSNVSTDQMVDVAVGAAKAAGWVGSKVSGAMQATSGGVKTKEDYERIVTITEQMIAELGEKYPSIERIADWFELPRDLNEHLVDKVNTSVFEPLREEWRSDILKNYPNFALGEDDMVLWGKRIDVGFFSKKWDYFILSNSKLYLISKGSLDVLGFSMSFDDVNGVYVFPPMSGDRFQISMMNDIRASIGFLNSLDVLVLDRFRVFLSVVLYVFSFERMNDVLTLSWSKMDIGGSVDVVDFISSEGVSMLGEVLSVHLRDSRDLFEMDFLNTLNFCEAAFAYELWDEVEMVTTDLVNKISKKFPDCRSSVFEKDTDLRELVALLFWFRANARINNGSVYGGMLSCGTARYFFDTSSYCGGLSDAVDLYRVVGVNEEYPSLVFEMMNRQKCYRMVYFDFVPALSAGVVDWIDPYLAKFFEFWGGPVEHKKIYAAHPYRPGVLIPLDRFDELILQERLHELSKLLQSLGASKVSLFDAHHREGTKESHRATSGGVEVELLGFEGQTSQSNKINQTTRRDVSMVQEFQRKATPDLVPDGLVWFPHETVWKFLAEGRLDSGMTHYTLDISTEDYLEVSGDDLNELKLMMQKDASMEDLKIDTLQRYVESHRESKTMRVEVEFYELFKGVTDSVGGVLEIEATQTVPEEQPIKNATANKPASTPTPDERHDAQRSARNEDVLNELTQDYYDMVVEILEEDGDLEPSRRMLSKFAGRLGLNDTQVAELEALAARQHLATSFSDAEAEYMQDVRLYVEDGEITHRERRFLERARASLGISPERAAELEQLVISSR